MGRVRSGTRSGPRHADVVDGGLHEAVRTAVARADAEADRLASPGLHQAGRRPPGRIAIRAGADGVVHERMRELSRTFPEGVTYEIPYDTAPFVKVSIEKVLVTFLEAMALVFAVMFLFLQKARYTLIPAIVAPFSKKNATIGLRFGDSNFPAPPF